MRKLRWHISFVIASLLAVGCAQVRSISGGEKDTTPPKLISASPENECLQFAGNSFTLNFDEYVQLRDIQKELLVSPPLKTTPRVKVRQRSVEVSWDDTLRAASTYIFQFGKSIVDVNESNALSDLNYVFSTGKELDSLVCSGNVIDAYADKPAASTKVLLFDSTQHIFHASARPAYFARTNEKGEFRFNYLRSGIYTLCALSDENGNNHFDIGESIDWKENVTTASASDTLLHTLFLSTPRDTVIRSFNYATDSAGILKFHVSRWLPSTFVRSIGADSIVQWTHADTLYAAAWSNCSKTVDVQVICGGKIMDTLSVQRLADGVSASKLMAMASPKLSAFDSVSVRARRPVVSVNDAFLSCLADSTAIACTSRKINPVTYGLQFEKKAGVDYSILALPGWLTDDCGATNDTLRMRFALYESKELGSLRFKLPKSVLTSAHSFQLLDKSKKVVFTEKSVSNREWVIDNLVPGEYSALICADTNSNGYFDPLQLNPLHVSERNHVYNASIQVRANWEVVIDWPDWGN
jgi:uncharacterized protein (DUF2141 family)